MQVHTVQPNQWMQYGITALVIVAVMALRLRNVGRTRRLRLETLWIAGLVLAVVELAT